MSRLCPQRRTKDALCVGVFGQPLHVLQDVDGIGGMVQGLEQALGGHARVVQLVGHVGAFQVPQDSVRLANAAGAVQEKAGLVASEHGGNVIADQVQFLFEAGQCLAVGRPHRFAHRVLPRGSFFRPRSGVVRRETGDWLLAGDNFWLSRLNGRP
jgi:hypothetical protein